jgi:hypothetical protein|tara:strand:+ start:223 stop:588 length:366 start_codon:yes stop_codon:yes gene_type:complete
MENYIKIKEAKPNNNEYVLLHTSVHDSKPKKLLYTNEEFIDFEMKPVSVEDDNYWRPVYGNNPITNHRSEIVTKKSDVPEGSQVDSYASNEYITTYPNKGSRFMYIHKKAEISTRWTGLDD